MTVKILTGRHFTLPVRSSSTLREIKKDIEEREGIPVEAMSLIFAGMTPSDEQTLADYTDRDDVTIHLVMPGRRGD